MEPLLEQVTLPPARLPQLGWVIVGGEHGPRPMHSQWASEVLQQCQEAGVPFFMKQMGGLRDKRDAVNQIPANLLVRQLPHIT